MLATEIQLINQLLQLLGLGRTPIPIIPTQPITPTPSNQPTQPIQPTQSITPQPGAPTLPPCEATPTSIPQPTNTFPITGTPTPTPIVSSCGSGYNLVWNDEFNGSSIDTSKWSVPTEDHRNNELQDYSASEVFVQNGLLTLRSSKNGNKYLSGAVTTKGKYAPTYGSIEMSAKLPEGGGMWPAFWLLPDSGGWAYEIDILETIGCTANKIWMTNYANAVQDYSSYCINGNCGGSDSSTGFHTYAVKWEPGSVAWYIDGIQRFQTSKPSVSNVPMYIYLNTAMGGDMPNSESCYVNDSTLPKYYRSNLEYG